MAKRRNKKRNTRYKQRRKTRRMSIPPGMRFDTLRSLISPLPAVKTTAMSQKSRRHKPRSTPKPQTQQINKYSTLTFDTKINKIKKVKNFCQKRTERKQVLHAINKTGKTGQKSPQWSEISRIKC